MRVSLNHRVDIHPPYFQHGNSRPDPSFSIYSDNEFENRSAIAQLIPARQSMVEILLSLQTTAGPPLATVCLIQTHELRGLTRHRSAERSYGRSKQTCCLTIVQEMETVSEYQNPMVASYLAQHLNATKAHLRHQR